VSQETFNRYFDELASGLASGSLTRGKALRLMGAALVGGRLASLSMGEAAAAPCRPVGKHCESDSKCCSGNCGEDHTCLPPCTPSGGDCVMDAMCCSNLCLQEGPSPTCA
jgi:hypothetical protein